MLVLLRSALRFQVAEIVLRFGIAAILRFCDLGIGEHKRRQGNKHTHTHNQHPDVHVCGAHPLVKRRGALLRPLLVASGFSRDEVSLCLSCWRPSGPCSSHNSGWTSRESAGSIHHMMNFSREKKPEIIISHDVLNLKNKHFLVSHDVIISTQKFAARSCRAFFALGDEVGYPEKSFCSCPAEGHLQM